MKVIDPGHVYELAWVDGEPLAVRARLRMGDDGRDDICRDLSEARLIFVKREGAKYPGNVGAHAGTQVQEVLRALIHRLQYVDQQEHSAFNDTTIVYLRAAIMALELRAAQRARRQLNVWTPDRVEEHPVCPKCGHIGCAGGCR